MMTDSGTDIDLAGLRRGLAERLDADVTGAVVADGLNRIVDVSTADGRYVVRRPNMLRGTYYTNDLRTEYEVLEALVDTPVPAPRPLLFEADPSALGGPFLVCTYLEGETVPLGSDLPERFRTERARAALGERLIDALAEIHVQDPGNFEACCDRRTPRETVGLARGRIEDVAAETDLDPWGLEAVADWLAAEAPPDPELGLVHGDFRPGNVLFVGQKTPEVAGVLDWETAQLGDPLVDLGYLLLRWGDEDDPTPPLDGIEARHPDADDALAEMAERNEGGLAPFTTRPGSPDRAALADHYERLTGRTFDNRRFYRAFAAFLLATVWADLHREAVATGRDSTHAPWVDYTLAMAGTVAGQNW